jgi:hypothetical protein
VLKELLQLRPKHSCIVPCCMDNCKRCACDIGTRHSNSGTWCHGSGTLATLLSVSSVGAPGWPLELGKLGRTGCGDSGESLRGLGAGSRCRGVTNAGSGGAFLAALDRDAASWALVALMTGTLRRELLSFRGDDDRGWLVERS